MRFSKKTDYAIVLIDALKQSYFLGTFESIADVAKRHRVPKLFLEKVAQELRAEKIVESRHGKAGGYRLIKNPTALTLWDIISVFEETDMKRRMKSLTADKNCPAAKFCQPKQRWARIEEKIQKIFQETMFV